MNKTTDYKPDKVAKQFLKDDSYVRALMGPVGSGKSVACCWALWMKAHTQEPNENGIRYTRWVIIRNTYRELVDTTLKTWVDWFEHAPGDLEKSSMTLTYEYALADGTHVNMEVLFRALDLPKDVKKLLSLEVTGGWINEVKEMPKSVFDTLTGRVGRYPAKRDGGPTWHGVVLDTNPPDEDHWFAKMFDENPPEGYKLFRQPSGLSENAENVANLPPNYYHNISQGKTKEWVDVFVHGEYGFVIDGKPIYPEYNATIHKTETPALNPIPVDYPVYVGIDFGLTPAAVFAYQDTDGQWVFFHEIVSESMGALRFGEILGQYIRQRIPNNRLEIWGDPAGEQRAQTDENTPFNILQAQGINAHPAPTNDYTIRREAVASCLTRLTHGGRPGFLLTPGCPLLAKAMAGGYRYRRLQVAGDERFVDKPDKNMYSHVAEAVQYLLCGAGEGHMVVGRNRAAESKPLDYSQIAKGII